MFGLDSAVKAQTLMGELFPDLGAAFPDLCPMKWNDSNGDCVADIAGVSPGIFARVLVIGGGVATASFAAWHSKRKRQ
jgi:hypothetical protein